MWDEYEKFMAEDQRLCILRVLEAAAQYTANTAMIERALDVIGHPIGRTKVVAHCEWLAEAGLCTIANPLYEAVQVVTATGTGVEVAEGKITRSGVQRPSAN